MATGGFLCFYPSIQTTNLTPFAVHPGRPAHQQKSGQSGDPVGPVPGGGVRQERGKTSADPFADEVLHGLQVGRRFVPHIRVRLQVQVRPGMASLRLPVALENGPQRRNVYGNREVLAQP